MSQTLKTLVLPFFLLSAFCFLPCAAYSGDEAIGQAKEHFAAGKRLMQEGRYSAADTEFKKAQEILKSPGAASPIIPKTTLKTKEKPIEPKRESGNPQDTSYYLEAVKKDPKNPDLHYNLAISRLKNSRFADAASSFKMALDLNPKDKDACYNLGVLYESYLNDKKQALNYYSRYLRLSTKAEDAKDVKSWINQIKKALKESKPHD